MPSLLLVVFVLQLLIHLVNTVGAPVINEFVRPSLRSCFGVYFTCSEQQLIVSLAMDTLQQTPHLHLRRC